MGARARRAAAVLAGAGLLVALAFLPRGCAEDAAPPPAAAGTEAAPPPPSPPLDPEQMIRPLPPRAGPEPAPAAEQHATPCGGCLPEAGALDVAETFLFHMRADYIDVRAELYSDIAARLEAAGQGPPHREYLPKLPPGLVDAPANYSLGGGRMLPEVERPGETWVVWVQEGWYTGESLEHLISIGDLPSVARSWPPLKWETYLLVDARTGEVFSRAMWPWWTPSMKDMNAYGDHARREAARRAEHWTSKGSAAPDER